MKVVKVKIVVTDDGKIVIDDLPVKSGQEVEVTIRIPEPVAATFPLRGLPVRYVDPFRPVDDDEWDASRDPARYARLDLVGASRSAPPCGPADRVRAAAGDARGQRDLAVGS